MQAPQTPPVSLKLKGPVAKGKQEEIEKHTPGYKLIDAAQAQLEAPDYPEYLLRPSNTENCITLTYHQEGQVVNTRIMIMPDGMYEPELTPNKYAKAPHLITVLQKLGFKLAAVESAERAEQAGEHKAERELNVPQAAIRTIQIGGEVFTDVQLRQGRDIGAPDNRVYLDFAGTGAEDPNVLRDKFMGLFKVTNPGQTITISNFGKGVVWFEKNSHYGQYLMERLSAIVASSPKAVILSQGVTEDKAISETDRKRLAEYVEVLKSLDPEKISSGKRFAFEAGLGMQGFAKFMILDSIRTSNPELLEDGRIKLDEPPLRATTFFELHFKASDFTVEAAGSGSIVRIKTLEGIDESTRDLRQYAEVKKSGTHPER